MCDARIAVQNTLEGNFEVFIDRSYACDTFGDILVSNNRVKVWLTTQTILKRYRGG